MIKKYIRGMIVFLLSALLIFSFCAIAEGENDVTRLDYGKCGSAVYWELDSAGTLRIYGTGKMYETYSTSDVMWSAYRDLIKSVEIESQVTSICSYAFYNCCNLTSLTIGNGVTAIGSGAFYHCTGLTDVTIPDSVTFISNAVFNGCVNMTIEKLPINLTEIGDYAFKDCSSLPRLTIPDGAKVYENTFAGVDWIIAAGTQGTLTYSHVIYDDGTLHITGSGNMASYLYSDAPWFSYRSSINSLVIGNKITRISEKSFTNLTNLTSITIPDSVTKIADYAFDYCTNLTSITIPDSVTSIGFNAFNYCTSLTNVYAENIEGWLGISFTNRYSNPMNYADNLYFNNELAINITIPDSVTSIGDYAFEYCNSLKNIIIPDSVTSIGYHAFEDCSSLTNIAIPDSVTQVDTDSFWGCSKLSKVYLLGEQAPAYSFSSIFSKTKVTIYCHEFSAVDFWATENGYNCVYVDPDVPELLTLIVREDTEIYPEETLPIQIYTFPQNVSKYNITWKNSDANVALVSDDEIIALSAGTTTITASCGVISDRIVVNVIPFTTPKMMSLPEDMRIDIDAPLTIPVNTAPMDASEYSIVWESSAPEVATVENGVVTPRSVGTTTITASCGNKSDSMTITVYAAVKSFDLSATELWVASKDTAQLSIENMQPASTTSIFGWESSDTSVLTVSESGLITAKVPGEATITITSDNGISRSCVVHVCYPVTAIDFDKASESVVVDGTVALTANVTARTQTFVNKLVTFSSSDESIAKVDENGIVTAVSPGVVTITAAAKSGVTADCSIVVEDRDTLYLPASLLDIEDEAFVGSSVERVILPEKVTSVGNRAFAACDRLEIVHMPDSVVSIAEDAFEGCEKITFICSSENSAAAYAIRHNIPYRIK